MLTPPIQSELNLLLNKIHDIGAYQEQNACQGDIYWSKAMDTAEHNLEFE